MVGVRARNKMAEGTIGSIYEVEVSVGSKKKSFSLKKFKHTY